MNARFRFTPEAEAQLAEIIDCLAADNEDAARRVLRDMHEALETVAEMPAVGHAREDPGNDPASSPPVSATVRAQKEEATPKGQIQPRHIVGTPGSRRGQQCRQRRQNASQRPAVP